MNQNYEANKKRKNLKKKYRYNDSINKYKKENPKLIKKKNVEININNEDLNLNRTSRLNGFSKDQREENDNFNYNPINIFERNEQIKRTRTPSAPRNDLLKKIYPKRNYNIIRNNIYLKTNNNSSLLNINNGSSEISQIDRNNNYYNILKSPFNKIRESNNKTSHKRLLTNPPNNFNTQRYRNTSDYSNINMNKTQSFKDDINNKKLLNMNKILLKTNRELREKNRMMNLEISDLINEQNEIKIENQNLFDDQNWLLIEIEELENELEYFRNLSLRDLEKRNIKIKELNDEIMNMKNMLNVKQSNINNIFKKNNNVNNEPNIKYRNNNVNNQNIEQDEILELDFNEESIPKTINNGNNNQVLTVINNLREQINNLKLKSQKIILDKQKNEKMLYQKINNLIQKNKEYSNIISKLQKEDIKDNNFTETQLRNQLKELQEKYDILQNKYNELNETMERSDKNFQIVIKERNDLLQQQTDLIKNQKSVSIISNSSNNIIEENKNLKKKINELEKQLAICQFKLDNRLQSDNCNSEITNLKQKNIELENINKNLLEINNQLEKEKENIINKDSGEREIGFEDGTFNININNNISEKNSKIENLEKVINDIKNVNDKLSRENYQLKEKLLLLEKGQEGDLINTLDNLRLQLKDKEMQIKKLKEEYQNIKSQKRNEKNNLNSFNINNEEEEEREIDLNYINPFNRSISSKGSNDTDKIKLYKEKIKNLEQINESDKALINKLNGKIKKLYNEILYFKTFGGQIKDMNEFRSLLNQVLNCCRPEKKEQKEAFEKIIKILSNFHG